MKKCPTCDKTFEDNLKFCQSDGTPLIAVPEDVPEDPYKTTVANQADLPIPPLDPMKTMVQNAPPAEAQSAEDAEPEIDAMKTMIASDFPSIKESEKEIELEVDGPQEPQPERSETPAPEPPKFSEPDLNPPDFAKPDSPMQAPEDTPAPQSSRGQVADSSNLENDLSGASPYGDKENAPIPSPFDLSMPPGYQIPSAPMPPYKEAEVEEAKAEALNTPFAEEVQDASQQIEQTPFSPPPAANQGWQPQSGTEDSQFQPSSSTSTGPSKTLAIASLASGVISMISLGGSIIPFVGVICGLLAILLAPAAIIVGLVARSRAKNRPDEYEGAGLALGGIITGALTILGMIALVIIAVLIVGFANFNPNFQ
ncbi:MAG: hypothetical protein KIS76_12470 [Pyrinomonadaceae bacterium]|nr:hypothetical protein [Pyrinomonadaceae bacterium]